MKSIHCLLLLMVALVLGVLPFNAKAQNQTCVVSVTVLTAPPPPVAINPNAPVGTVLWDSVKNYYTLQGQGPIPACAAGQTGSITYAGTQPYLGNHIYSSGIPGIGIKFYTYNTHECYPGTPGPLWPVTCKISPYNINNVNGTYTYGIQMGVTLIKTGNIDPTRLSFSGAFATSMTTEYPLGNPFATYVWSGAFTIVPQSPTCSVTTPSVTVPLGSVLRKTFTGVGSTSTAVPFNLQVTCAGGVAGSSSKIYVTLTDAANPGNTSQVLSLTPGSTTATGIGIQVLKGTTVLGYGPDSEAPGNTNQWQAGTASAGTSTLNIPLSARYVQTSASVTTGSANAAATFTMSYQ